MKDKKEQKAYFFCVCVLSVVSIFRLPRLLLYIKSQISGVRQTGAFLSTEALYLGVVLLSPVHTQGKYLVYFENCLV